MPRLKPFLQPWLFVIAVFILCAISVILYTAQYSVNMMFWDQWSVYSAFISHGSWLDAFRAQVGQHRQGLGALFIYIASSLTAWDGKADAFLVAITLILSTILTLILIKRYIGTLSIFDVCIPILFLSLNQWELLTIVPNLSAAALPLLLVILYSLGLTIKQPHIQAIVLTILNALLLYTGYGLIASFITPLLFLWRSINPQKSGFAAKTRWLWIAGLILCIVFSATYFADYAFAIVVDCPVFPHPFPLDYAVFAGLMVAQGFGFAPLADQLGFANGIAMVIGITFILAGVGIAIKSIATQRGAVVAFLIGYSLLFIASATAGRVCLGATRQPLSSRYITLVLPLILGIYLWARTQNSKRQITAGSGILALVLLSLLPPFYRSPYTLTPQVFHDYKTAWKSCYLSTLDPYHCNDVAQYPMYPETQAIVGSLRYLEKNRLNLFRDVAQDMQITFPADGAIVTTPRIELLGIVNPPDFERYEVQWGTSEYPKTWQWLSGPHLSPIPNGKITEWDISSLPSGLYTVRVTAHQISGGQRVAIVRFTKP